MDMRRFKNLFCVLLLLLAVAALATVFILLFKSRLLESREKRSLLEHWENNNWEKAYLESKESLAKKPMDPFFLMINGFAAYQTAIAQVSNENALEYIEECIRSLRKSLLIRNADKDGRIRYVLGKAYYAKGPDYADLAVKYLEEAKSVSFNAADFYEYLGLSYAAIKNYPKSIEAFTGALDPAPGGGSDLLLLHIAQSYMGVEDWETAKAYLLLCADKSKDADLALKARLLLGKALASGGDTDGAIAAFESVLESAGENAEASFEMGEIYAARGDNTRARAAWRRARRADPNFAPAAARLM